MGTAVEQSKVNSGGSPSPSLKCNKTISLKEAFFYSLMIGAGESYFSAFVLFLGFSESLTGIFASLPLALGAALQLMTPWGLRRVGSAKIWSIGAAGLQAMSLLCFAVFAILYSPGSGFFKNSIVTSDLAVYILFLVASIYWASAYSFQSVWNRWMAGLVRADESSDFFTRRLRSTQYGTLIGLLLAGYALSHAFHVGPYFAGFAIIFLFAASSRFVSSLYLSKKDSGVTESNAQGLRHILTKVWSSGSERDLVIFLFLFGVGVYVSSPFVNPLLLSKFKFGAFEYSIALVSLFLGKIIGFTVTHKYLGKWTSEKAMLFGALGISPLPALWAFATTPALAGMLQLASGLAWGIYEASLALILFRRLKNESKVALMCLINFVQCAAILFGGLVGGGVLKFFGENIFAYNCVFVLSSSLRLLICLLFAYTWLYAKGRRVEDSSAPANFELKLR